MGGSQRARATDPAIQQVIDHIPNTLTTVRGTMKKAQFDELERVRSEAMTARATQLAALFESRQDLMGSLRAIRKGHESFMIRVRRQFGFRPTERDCSALANLRFEPEPTFSAPSKATAKAPAQKPQQRVRIRP